VLAVRSLGGLSTSTPKRVLDLMQVQGMTLQHVKSHLQKYRLQDMQAAADASAAPAAWSTFMQQPVLPPLFAGSAGDGLSQELLEPAWQAPTRQGSNVSSADFLAATGSLNVPSRDFHKESALAAMPSIKGSKPTAKKERKASKSKTARPAPAALLPVAATVGKRQQLQSAFTVDDEGLALDDSALMDLLDGPHHHPRQANPLTPGGDLSLGGPAAISALDLDPDLLWPQQSECMADLLHGSFLEDMLEDMAQHGAGTTGGSGSAPTPVTGVPPPPTVVVPVAHPLPPSMAPTMRTHLPLQASHYAPPAVAMASVPAAVQHHLQQLQAPVGPLVPLLTPCTLAALQPRTLAEMSAGGLELSCGPGVLPLAAVLERGPPAIRSLPSGSDVITEALRTQQELHRQLSVHLERTRQRNSKRKPGPKVASAPHSRYAFAVFGGGIIQCAVAGS
jgi:SHAQKYF class myb-like DNA-binding protein